MTLRWNHKHGNLFATGTRGNYVIAQRSFSTKVLTCTGFDGLPLLDLPPFGAAYLNEVHARDAADEIDSRPFVEAQMSGC